MRQIMILFFFTGLAGILRITTPESGKFLSKSSWLSPFFALLPILLLIFILHKIIEKNRDKSLSQIIEKVFGKILGKTILFVFLTHVLFFSAFFLRNFGEKFVSSIFPKVSPMFFMIILLLAALFAARRNIEAFARFSEFSFLVISVMLVISFFIALFHISPDNLYPVTYYDAPYILNSSVPLISLWSLLTFALFLGDDINYAGRLNKDDESPVFRRTAAKFMLVAALLNFLGLTAVIGVFSAETAANLSMPYFYIFKSIKSVGLIQSFETFFIILWAFADFIMIAFFLFVLSKIFKTAFVIDSDKTKLYMFPFCFIILILAYLIGENNLDAEYFYTNILSYSSIILGYIFPFLLLTVGKLRKAL
jgi:spore germination protein KB